MFACSYISNHWRVSCAGRNSYSDLEDDSCAAYTLTLTLETSKINQMTNITTYQCSHQMNWIHINFLSACMVVELKLGPISTICGEPTLTTPIWKYYTCIFISFGGIESHFQSLRLFFFFYRWIHFFVACAYVSNQFLLR